MYARVNRPLTSGSLLARSNNRIFLPFIQPEQAINNAQGNENEDAADIPNGYLEESFEVSDDQTAADNSTVGADEVDESRSNPSEPKVNKACLEF